LPGVQGTLSHLMVASGTIIKPSVSWAFD